jgi:hypothetical protein
MSILLIDGEPPIYVGIYVDDIIYFSTSDAVERKFKSFFQLLGRLNLLVR